MDTTILCSTKPRDSDNKIGLKFHKEYAIATNLTDQEKEKYATEFGMTEVYEFHNPCVSMRRRVDNDSGIVVYWNWDILDIMQSEKSCVMSFGDTEYWNGDSLTEIHEWAKYTSETENLLRAEWTELRDRLEPHKFSRQSLLVQEYNEKYDAELRSKRLYSKAQKGTAPKDIITEISNRLKSEYQEEKNRVEFRIDEIKNLIDESMEQYK